jgi:hypothetical protein
MKACPAATASIKVNLANRQKALDVANYGPADPSNPGTYWEEKGTRMHTDPATAAGMRCGNCSFFNIGPDMMHCISIGIGEDAKEVELAGQLGFCEAFDFKCAAKRTCDAWVVGGPVRENVLQSRMGDGS